jgi:hypothetical protein
MIKHHVLYDYETKPHAGDWGLIYHRSFLDYATGLKSFNCQNPPLQEHRIKNFVRENEVDALYILAFRLII